MRTGLGTPIYIELSKCIAMQNHIYISKYIFLRNHNVFFQNHHFLHALVLKKEKKKGSSNVTLSGAVYLPGVDDLALHRVVIKDALHVGVDWFSGVLIQAHNISSVMLTLECIIKQQVRRSTVNVTSLNISKILCNIRKRKLIYTLRATITSWVSRPEFSARVLGITRSASANASTPSCAR